MIGTIIGSQFGRSGHPKILSQESMMEKVELSSRQDGEVKNLDSKYEEPAILKEIEIEEIFIDGICGVY
jgi:mycofactocin precursor